MSKRMDQEREARLQPKRMETAIEEITAHGFDITYQDASRIEFDFKGSKVQFFPYSGWHTGKTIKDGRGLVKLLIQLK